MKYNDDEKIVVTSTTNSASDDGFDDGVLTLTLINNETAPLTKNEFNVMVSLTGTKTSSDRHPLDLVMVLDISGSMYGNKLKKMKTATEYVISKLGQEDRVTVVTFNHIAHRLCPLRQATDESKMDILHLVNAIRATGSTNITDGLQMGLKVLNDRRYTDDNRVEAIMLMSDGEQNDGPDAAHVDVTSLPVFTFGFGTDHEPTVLKAIADNSGGGTFSDVQDVDHLSAAFAQCLAGLLIVLARDLTLTVTSTKTKIGDTCTYTIDSTIKKVYAGNYKQQVNGDSVTVTFGNIYSEEVRNVIIALDLPAVSCEKNVDVLKVEHAYRSYGKDSVETFPSVSAQIERTAASEEIAKEELVTEMCRVLFVEKIKEARVLAEGNHMESARTKLKEAGKVLDDCNSINSSITTMKHELEHLSDLMISREVYIKQGRSFVFSFESSHDRQRFALRGNAEKHRMFAIPHMDEHFEAVKSSGH